MGYEYTLAGEVPSKKNSRVTNRRTGRSFPNRRFVEWHKGAFAEVASQGIPSEPLGCANVVVTFIHTTRRRRDGDNQLSSVLDLLVDAGVLKDDSWLCVPHFEVFHAKGFEDLCMVNVEGREP